MKLTVENVTAMFEQCQKDDAPEIEGVIHSARIDVTGHEQEITDMLGQLPNEFQSSEKGGGGGWSFLNMCNDKDGVQWTGMHIVMEQLCLLGLAADALVWCLPREFWSSLPGGMPYLVVK